MRKLFIFIFIIFCFNAFAEENLSKNNITNHFNSLAVKGNFGKNYGILIKELRLLARSIFVYDKSGNLVYSELVSEVTHEPNYDAALGAVKKAL